MDITFWVLQVVLLAPVLFMAASASKEDESKSKGLPAGEARAPDEPGSGRVPSSAAQSAARLAAPAGNLSQFSVQEQARLVLLRCLVQEARQRGLLTEDLLAADDDHTPGAEAAPVPLAMTRVANAPKRARGRRTKASAHLVVAGCALVMAAVGVAGIVRGNLAIDQLQRTSLARTASLSPATRLLPGMIANPAKYLSALTTSEPTAGPGSARSDPLFDVGYVDQKQAIDRWEAMAAIGLSVLLFVCATRTARARSPGQADAASSIAFDLAPFLVVAAVLFAGLSFFEIP